MRRHKNCSDKRDMDLISLIRFRNNFLIFIVFFGVVNSQQNIILDNVDSPCTYEIGDNFDNFTQDQLVEILTHACRYDKSIRAPSDDPLQVQVQLDINHIETADNIQFRAYILVQLQFNDYRLNYAKKSPKRGPLIGESSLRKHFYVPHLIIRNEKTTKILGYDGQDVFITVSPNGTIIYNSRMAVEFYCWMNLGKFPFDSQSCDLNLNSWKYDIRDVVLSWGDDGVNLAQDFHLTEFWMANHSTSADTVQYSFKNGPLNGEFSQLVLKFVLKREVGYYIMDYFLPSILLVCTSWVTFWLQADAGPPRATIGTSTALAFITLNSGMTKNLPKVSYVKASDIWFLVCFCFIFGSLCEFAFVNVIWRRRKTVELKKQTVKHILIGAMTPSAARRQVRKNASTPHEKYSGEFDLQSVPSLNTSQLELVHNNGSSMSIEIPDGDGNNKLSSSQFVVMEPREIAIWVDRKSRVIFPVAFIIFNIFYWSLVYTL